MNPSRVSGEGTDVEIASGRTVNRKIEEEQETRGICYGIRLWFLGFTVDFRVVNCWFSPRSCKIIPSLPPFC